jgi:uncharacterized membrane protein
MENVEPFKSAKERIVFISQFFFCLGIIGIGLQQFIYSNFIPVMLPGWPSWIPGRSACAFFLGAFLISAGVLIIMKKHPRIVATRLGIMFILLFLFTLILQFAQNKIINLLNLGIWTNTFKEFAFCGSAFVVAASLPQGKPHEVSIIEKIENKLISFGKFPLAIMVVIFGIDHFIYIVLVSSLIPAWIPGHLFLTYFSGAALIASGIGIILNIKARLAATMLGSMMFIWVIILHIPRAIADPTVNMGNEWTTVFEVLGFSGIAFILGQSLPLFNSGKALNFSERS